MSRGKQRPFQQVGSVGRDEMQEIFGMTRLYTWSKIVGQLWYDMRRRFVDNSEQRWQIRDMAQARLREIRREK